MERDGMDMNELEEAIASNEKIKFIYTIPDFQNPTGYTMSLEKREKLINIAEKYNIPIIEDSPYSNLKFEDTNLPKLMDLDKKGLVINLGSFSKVFSPGLRIGWIHAAPEIITNYVHLKQAADIHSSEFNQFQCMNVLSDLDIPSHINKLRLNYRDKCYTMVDALVNNLKVDLNIEAPKGGLFLWLSFPDEYDVDLIVEELLKRKVIVIPGKYFFTDNRGKNTIRLTYATNDLDSIRKGCEIIALVINEY